MNLRDLEYLVAVDDERHFNKAAERCFVSQPTLSGQLKKLEEELGVMLVERNNRQVAMTEVGAIVSQRARRVLSQVRAIRDIAASYHDPMKGELHVGLIPTLAPYLLPQIMPSLKRRFPNLRLWLYEKQTDDLLRQLRNGELDLAILALPVETDEFAELDLFRESFWLAIPRSDPLAEKKTVTLSDIHDREMLLLQEGHCLRGQALDVCFAAGASENSGFRATSLETLRHMVSEGLGATLIPELAIPPQRKKSDPIRYLPFSEPAPGRRIGLLFRERSYRVATFEKIAEVLRTQFTDPKAGGKL